MNIGVSVIICCYNSARRLPTTLKYLAKQEVESSILWEILVVDNASKDNTAEVVTDLCQQLEFPCPVRMVFEKTPGLTNARKAGISDSKYEFIVFCDDDNWLSPNYVSGAYSILVNNKQCGMAGTKISPEFETKKPKWFDSYTMYYSVGERSITTGDVTDSVGTILGAGMITRKSLWMNVYETNYTFLCVDRMKNSLSTGGDMEMCIIAQKLGYRIYYSNELSLKHFIPQERLTLKYLKRNAFGVGMFYVLINPYSYLTIGQIKKNLWIRDFVYNIFQLRKPLFKLFFFKRIEFLVEFNLVLGKLFCLISLRNQYLANIEYIKKYYATRF